jgi:hypothetical protein
VALNESLLACVIFSSAQIDTVRYAEKLLSRLVTPWFVFSHQN